jgi:hypothetical protein
VKSETGRPGDGLDCEDPEAARERVFEYDWYDVYPPSVKQLSEAWDRAAAVAR